jgi:membrane associated rhomboid family serine protease
MGAYFVNFPGARVIALVPIGCLLPVVELPALVFLLVWFATNFMSGVASIGVQAQGGVAFWAHVGGFVIGMFLSIILKRTNLRSSPTTDA